MYSSLRFSFFITKDMKVSLDSQELKGTLPILYVFLARADKSITDVSFGSLSSGGQFQQSRGGGGATGVRINYIDNHSGQQQTLYYFTTDISDGGLASSGFLKFCDHFGVGSSFLKSSSYLMFERSEEHTSELQSRLVISYAVFCLKKKKKKIITIYILLTLITKNSNEEKHYLII